jgi:WD40 repeat protein
MKYRFFCFFFFLYVGELYTVACSPADPLLVATGGGDDKGFLWKIGLGDWAAELKGMIFVAVGIFSI